MRCCVYACVCVCVRVLTRRWCQRRRHFDWGKYSVEDYSPDGWDTLEPSADWSIMVFVKWYGTRIRACSSRISRMSVCGPKMSTRLICRCCVPWTNKNERREEGEEKRKVNSKSCSIMSRVECGKDSGIRSIYFDYIVLLLKGMTGIL